MKKIIALILVAILAFSCCALAGGSSNAATAKSNTLTVTVNAYKVTATGTEVGAVNGAPIGKYAVVELEAFGDQTGTVTYTIACDDKTLTKTGANNDKAASLSPAELYELADGVSGVHAYTVEAVIVTPAGEKEAISGAFEVVISNIGNTITDPEDPDEPETTGDFTSSIAFASGSSSSMWDGDQVTVEGSYNLSDEAISFFESIDAEYNVDYTYYVFDGEKTTIAAGGQFLVETGKTYSVWTVATLSFIQFK